jgi:hypothetical protein
MSVTTERTTPSTEAGPVAGERSLARVLLALAAVLGAYQLVTAPFIPVLTVFTVLYGAAGIGLWRSRSRWLLVVAGLLATAHAAGAAPVFAEHFAHPESPLGFLTDAGILIGLAAVVVGVVRALRGASPAVHRPVLVGAGALGALALTVSAAAVVGTQSDDRQPDDVELVVSDWAYPDLTLPATTDALWVDNRDPFHHTLVVEGTDLRVVLPAGTAVRTPIDLAPGTYRYACDVPGHEAMIGTLRVP